MSGTWPFCWHPLLLPGSYKLVQSSTKKPHFRIQDLMHHEQDPAGAPGPAYAQLGAAKNVHARFECS